MIEIKLKTGEVCNLMPETVDTVYSQKGKSSSLVIGTVEIEIAESAADLSKRIAKGRGFPCKVEANRPFNPEPEPPEPEPPFELEPPPENPEPDPVNPPEPENPAMFSDSSPPFP